MKFKIKNDVIFESRNNDQLLCKVNNRAHKKQNNKG